jgi:benzoylformate decarboxylase
LTPETVFRAIAARIPPETILFEESPSSRQLLQQIVQARRPLGFVSASMGGLGFAMPAAAGLRLARPDRPVVAVVGDGSAIYNIHSLWSAQTYGLRVLYIVMSNGGYAIMNRLAAEHGGKGPWPETFGLDICAIASGFGCRAERVSSLSALCRLLDDVVPTLADAGPPLVIDVELRAGS